MELYPITNAELIKDTHRKMKIKLLNRGICMRVRTGSQAGSSPQIAVWNDNTKIWCCFGLYAPFWCSFGVDHPGNREQVNIICQTNMAREGYNRRHGALFAREKDSREIYLVHRGKIGGGRPNICKTGFWRHYQGESATTVYGYTEEKVAVIGSPSSSSFPKDMARFVHETARIKEVLANEYTAIDM